MFPTRVAAALLVASCLAAPASAQEIRLAYLTGDTTLSGVLAAWKALLDEHACIIAGERERLAAGLREGGWLEPAPSEANFLLCRMSDRLGGGGAALREALARRGVFVRFFSDPRLRRHVRISVGTPGDTDRALAALDEAGRELEGQTR